MSCYRVELTTAGPPQGLGNSIELRLARAHAAHHAGAHLVGSFLTIRVNERQDLLSFLPSLFWKVTRAHFITDETPFEPWDDGKPSDRDLEDPTSVGGGPQESRRVK